MSEVVLRAVLAAVAVMGQSRLPGLVKHCTYYRPWLHAHKSREMAHQLGLSFLLPNPFAWDCLQVAALPMWAILPNVVSLETQLLTWSTCRLIFILEIMKGSQVLSFVLPAAVFDLCQWARLVMQQIFPLHISPASQRDEVHFAVTEPSWCLPERSKIQHEMHPFATMPCSYTDLSVLCSVSYLAHPSYITALSTCCSLKCKCRSLSGRASPVSSVGNQKWKTHRQTNVKNLDLHLLSMYPRVLPVFSLAYQKMLSCEHLMDRIKFVSYCLGEGSATKSGYLFSCWDQPMVTLGRKLNSDFLSASKCLHPKTICLLLPHFALFLLWVGKPFLPPAREVCHCLLTLPGVTRIEPRTVQQWVPLLWLRSFSFPALADIGKGVLNQPFLHWPQCSAFVFLTSSHGVVCVWQSAVVLWALGCWITWDISKPHTRVKLTRVLHTLF